MHGICEPAPSPEVKTDRAPRRRGRDVEGPSGGLAGEDEAGAPQRRRGPAPSTARLTWSVASHASPGSNVGCTVARPMSSPSSSNAPSRAAPSAMTDAQKAMWPATLCSPELSGSHVGMSATTTGVATRRPSVIRYWTSTCSGQEFVVVSANRGGVGSWCLSATVLVGRSPGRHRRWPRGWPRSRQLRTFARLSEPGWRSFSAHSPGAGSRVVPDGRRRCRDGRRPLWRRPAANARPDRRQPGSRCQVGEADAEPVGAWGSKAVPESPTRLGKRSRQHFPGAVNGASGLG